MLSVLSYLINFKINVNEFKSYFEVTLPLNKINLYLGSPQTSELESGVILNSFNGVFQLSWAKVASNCVNIFRILNFLFSALLQLYI